jgi:hypothetical protein
VLAFLLVGLAALSVILVAGSANTLGPPEKPVKRISEKEAEAELVKEPVWFGILPTTFERTPPPLPAVAPRPGGGWPLPDAPAKAASPVYLGDDLGRVPEVMYEAQPASPLTAAQWRHRLGVSVAAALRHNAAKEDGLIKALLSSRADLRGLPFSLGEACRTPLPRARAFEHTATLVRRLGQDAVEHFRRFTDEADIETEGHVRAAQLDAVKQVMGVSDAGTQEDALRFLAEVPGTGATAELARLAVFSTEERVRASAIRALSGRPPQEATLTLVAALRHPWPPAARNAADAIVKLRRKDLLLHLVAMLDAPDPRAPYEEQVGQRTVAVAREVVRINHHRNCMLCHAPAGDDKVPEGVLVAEMPIPSEELPGSQAGDAAVYSRSDSLLTVRVDVTYLRQDFSAMMRVKEARPWPEMQRFDFVVRKRELSREEADDLRERLKARGPGAPESYQAVVIRALRRLTGRDLGVRAEAWREVLKLDS